MLADLPLASFHVCDHRHHATDIPGTHTPLHQHHLASPVQAQLLAAAPHASWLSLMPLRESLRLLPLPFICLRRLMLSSISMLGSWYSCSLQGGGGTKVVSSLSRAGQGVTCRC